MALSFSTTLKSAYFTSEFPDVRVSTSADVVYFSLYLIGHNSTGDSYARVFFNTYYVANGSAVIYDVRSIMEDYMAENDLSVAEFRLTFDVEDGGTLSRDILAVYCLQVPRDVSVESFIQDSFLTSVIHRFITPDAKEFLYYYLPFQESDREVGSYRSVTVRNSLVMRAPDGTLVTTESLSVVRTVWGLNQIDMSLSRYESYLPSDDYTLVSFSVAIDARRVEFFVDYRHSQRQFYFRNAFRIWELAIIPSSQKFVVDTDSALALCGDKFIPYDVQHSRTFEVQSAPLLITHMMLMEQFVTSEDIRINVPYISIINNLPKVILLDYTYELQDAPGAVNVFTFTWRYANRRSYMEFPEIPTGIFTEQFSLEFA